MFARLNDKELSSNLKIELLLENGKKPFVQKKDSRKKTLPVVQHGDIRIEKSIKDENGEESKTVSIENVLLNPTSFCNDGLNFNMKVLYNGKTVFSEENFNISSTKNCIQREVRDKKRKVKQEQEDKKEKEPAPKKRRK